MVNNYACRRSTMDGSTDTKGSGASTAASGPDIVSDENGAWGESLKASWKPFSLNPWRLFLDCRAAHIVTVEPVVFLYMYGTYLFLFATQQYYFWRYGKEALTNTSFPYLNRSAFCISTDDLDTYGTNDTSNDVQTSANSLLSYSNLPGLLISIVVAMIFGPLSDTLGRKFIFFSVGTGVVVQGVLAFVLIWFESDMYLFILSSAVPGFFGGYASMLAASFSYAADISTPGKCRSIRIAVIEAMIYASGAVSEGGAGGMLQRLNCTFWPLILMYMASGVLILVYTAVFLPEPLSRLERLQKVADRPKGVKSLLNGLKIFLCPSEYSTWKLWAALIVLCIMVSNFVGSQEITAFFLEGHPLKWGPAVIGIYDVVAMVTHGVATIAVLSLLVALSLPDVVIALIGVVFSGGMNLFTGFVKNTGEMFLAATLSGMEAVIIPSIRSVMSKMVAARDQGALFAFVASSEVLASAVATAFYPNVYPLTLNHGLRPGTAYLIMATLCIVPVPLLIALWVSTRHSHKWICCRGRRGRSETIKPPPSFSDEETEELLKDSYKSIQSSHERSYERSNLAIN